MKHLDIVIATNNKHKIEEYKELFKDLDVNITSLKDEKINSDPTEDGATFEENALIKAKAIKDKTNKIILSDDSGISIDMLGNDYPGIYSHRYQESLGGAKKANEIIVSKMPFSKAHYTCVIVIENYAKSPLIFKGYIYGKISSKVKGEHGFGYDPIFIPEGYNKTLGELDDKTKNSISHRANAISQFIKYLKENNSI